MPNICIFVCNESTFSILAYSNERYKVERVEYKMDGILSEAVGRITTLICFLGKR